LCGPYQVCLLDRREEGELHDGRPYQAFRQDRVEVPRPEQKARPDAGALDVGTG
jgi:hypothetical protein